MYDVSKLKTIDECRTVMDRAKKLGKTDIYKIVFQRLCQLHGTLNEDPDDTLIKEFWETLGAYEQLLSEKNGRKTSASRTRQKIKNKGVIQSLIDWTKSKSETPGFIQLINEGMPQYTGEYIVVKYASRFPLDVVQSAKALLDQHNVEWPEEQ